MQSHSTPSLTTDMTCQDVELRGHIIDSLILPKVLDAITSGGGSFRIKHIAIGQARQDPSQAVIEVQAANQQLLDDILAHITDHGAVPLHNEDCQLVEADVEGAFPEGFYSTTNQRTEVRLAGQWIPVQDQEMDCGVVVEPARSLARCLPMSDVQRGQLVVVGHTGVRVFPPARIDQVHSFEFMNSAVSSEKPKGIIVRRIAEQLRQTRNSGGKTLLVGGPAIVHTGSSELVCRLIRDGYIDVLFAGNALAAHDIEQALFGTSLGVHLSRGDIVEFGHEHHLRAINRIRRVGGIRQAVEQGMLTEGIMYECVRNNVDFVLAGSIRDDGPLPDVVTDALEAQRKMRERIHGVTFCVMVATTLHSIAVGNLLPAWVEVVCVDINPSTVIKLNDRGSFQTVGVVTDVAPFLTHLVAELDLLEQAGAAENPPRR
jgi:lysine-ketoglutarate reductase/saccharopine dehydrogenase-like protein (TIGR00300 family)